MNLMVVKRFIRNSVSQVEVVVFRVHSEWENMYVVSSPKYSNTFFGNGYTQAVAVWVSGVWRASPIWPNPSRSLCYLHSNTN